ncbi:uncharacterized protein LOC131954490 [Physella acuta]|uniref:uncharacterized protein LOC131954490 n=1 Tax=Physella acuta TaxID=109671 RepID=UPI0027DDE923|nr:uncharacterized protein LOC131954490 [Physella acuta]
MPLIEGLGDEVTIVLGIFLLGVILMLAWISTHTSDIFHLREVGVIVVELSQRRSRTQIQAVTDNVTSEENNTINSSEVTSAEDVSHSDEAGPSSSDINDLLVREVEAQKETTENGTGSDPPVVGASDQKKDCVTQPTNGNIESKSSASLHSDVVTEKTDTEEVLASASVIVEENKGFSHSLAEEHPTEEEIRRRRVEYFQTSHIATSRNFSPPQEDSADSNSETGKQSEHLNCAATPPCSSGDKEHSADNQQIVQETTIPSQSTADTRSNLSPSVADSNEEQENAISRIRVKLKYMNETQRLVYANPFDTIGDFRRTHFQPELQDNKWVRFIYNGQDLRDDTRTLQACNVNDNCTMHCLITAQSQATAPSGHGHEDDEDSIMGVMMYPLFTAILLLVWYFRFTYRQYFSAMSTVCLIGITFLLALSYISSLRTADRRNGQQATQQASTNRNTQNHPHSD